MLITALSESHVVWDLARVHAFIDYFKIKMKTRVYAGAGEWGNLTDIFRKPIYINVSTFYFEKNPIILFTNINTNSISFDSASLDPDLFPLSGTGNVKQGFTHAKHKLPFSYTLSPNKFN